MIAIIKQKLPRTRRQIYSYLLLDTRKTVLQVVIASMQC